MPLTKVEELTNILTDRGYNNPPRSHRRRAVFRNRSELLVMSMLYLLGTGAPFRSCKPLCGISMSEVCKLFYKFIEALVDMKDEYLSPSEFNRVKKRKYGLQCRRITRLCWFHGGGSCEVV